MINYIQSIDTFVEEENINMKTINDIRPKYMAKFKENLYQNSNKLATSRNSL